MPQLTCNCRAPGSGLTRSFALRLQTLLFTIALFLGLPVWRLSAQQTSEVDQLRSEVRDLHSKVDRLETLLQQLANSPRPPVTPSEAVESASAKPTQFAKGGTPQTTGVTENPNVAMATKAQGGDLSGAGNLLKTDRVTIGGYGDFQFRNSGLNERADGGGTPTFQNSRMVLGIAAVLSEKQNVVFNSEIEWEFGSAEIDVEQAFVEWKMRPEFAVRAGIFPPSIGHFNTYHDSNINIATLRPLLNQYILPTAYRDAGAGIRGRFNLPRRMKLTYEANVLNGMQNLNADGEATPFSRLYGQSSAAEPGLIAFQAIRSRKAYSGRIGFSPLPGLEFGGSAYNSPFTPRADPERTVTMAFFDATYRRGPLQISGEYGRSNIVGGIPRQSPPPPLVNPSSPDSVAALSQYVADLSPGQDGYYVEGAYNFTPSFLRKHFDEGAYIAPVFRFEGIRRDRTLQSFYLNESRATLGINFAPSSTVIFKFDYLINHPYGPLPGVPGVVNGAFGTNPLPYFDYGKNGFTGSVAYVF